MEKEETSPFSNKLGLEIFKANFLDLQKTIPQSRFIDKEYELLKKRSLIREETQEDNDEKIYLKYAKGGF